MKRMIESETHGEERAFYGLRDARLVRCSFEGDEDGESALKECSDLELSDCRFELRYPLWHVKGAELCDCRMSETCRAALWYCSNIDIRSSTLGGIKAVRECEDVALDGCTVTSTEFGWKTRGFTACNTEIRGEYAFLDSARLKLDNVRLCGKYSFQYVKGAVVTGSVLDTKDAFWHAEDVTVCDSVIKGEYLGWYSKRLRLVRCRISGTQPLCYAEELTLEDCVMEDCDLSFEKSTVHAEVSGEILSVKNPSGGVIVASSVGEVISEDGREKKTLLTLPSGKRYI